MSMHGWVQNRWSRVTVFGAQRRGDNYSLFFQSLRSEVRSCFAHMLTLDKPDIQLHNEQQPNGSDKATHTRHIQSGLIFIHTGWAQFGWAGVGLCRFTLVNGMTRYHFNTCSAGVPKGSAGMKQGLWNETWEGGKPNGLYSIASIHFYSCIYEQYVKLLPI